MYSGDLERGECGNTITYDVIKCDKENRFATSQATTMVAGTIYQKGFTAQKIQLQQHEKTRLAMTERRVAGCVRTICLVRREARDAHIYE